MCIGIGLGQFSPNLFILHIIIGVSLSEPHINGYFNAHSVYIMDLGMSVTRAPLHTFSTKAACNVFGCKVCVVKKTASLCSNIAHIGLCLVCNISRSLVVS